MKSNSHHRYLTALQHDYHVALVAVLPRRLNGCLAASVMGASVLLLIAILGCISVVNDS